MEARCFDGLERLVAIGLQRGNGVEQSASVWRVSNMSLRSQLYQVPAYITATRSATCETTARSCEINRWSAKFGPQFGQRPRSAPEW
jgi:hypothetical protein